MSRVRTGSDSDWVLERSGFFVLKDFERFRESVLTCPIAVVKEPGRGGRRNPVAIAPGSDLPGRGGTGVSPAGETQSLSLLVLTCRSLSQRSPAAVAEEPSRYRSRF